MNSYYYIGHFSKFARPGARRVACTSSSDDLQATAFLNPDGHVAPVLTHRIRQAVDTASVNAQNIANSSKLQAAFSGDPSRTVLFRFRAGPGECRFHAWAS
ncbi:MAG: glycoside hydrolase family 30 beta sandwich domain-containing protein [Acidobacteriota bacterium]